MQIHTELAAISCGPTSGGAILRCPTSGADRRTHERFPLRTRPGSFKRWWARAYERCAADSAGSNISHRYAAISPRSAGLAFLIARLFVHPYRLAYVYAVAGAILAPRWLGRRRAGAAR